MFHRTKKCLKPLKILTTENSLNLLFKTKKCLKVKFKYLKQPEL